MSTEKKGPREKERDELLKKIEASVPRELRDAIELAACICDDEEEPEVKVSHRGSADANAA